VLLIDVDGVLSLWGFDPNTRPHGAYASVEGIVHFLSHDAARNLLAVAPAFDCVWCTGWEEKANEHLPAALGVGPFPHVALDAHQAAGTSTPGHWKLGAIEAYVGGRPAAWIDDALDDTCRAWARERPAPTLLVETLPSEGLTAAQAAGLSAWAASVTRSRPPRLDA
jgi:hypothetical protein